MGVDPTFGVNDYNKPKVLTEMETIVRNIMMVLTGKPGFYPSIPDLGMDIGQYLYQFPEDINEDEIKDELVNQCNEFLPMVESGDIDVYKANRNGRTVLVFVMPVIDDTERRQVALGVTVNEKGEFVYNFVEDTYQMI